MDPTLLPCTIQLLDERQTASLLRLQTKTLQTWRSRGFGPPFVRVGRCVRYRVPDLEAYLAKNTRLNPK